MILSEIIMVYGMKPSCIANILMRELKSLVSSFRCNLVIDRLSTKATLCTRIYIYIFMPTTVSSRRTRSTHLLSAYYSGNQHNDNRWLKQRHFCQCVSPSKAAGSNSFSDIIPNGYTEYARELNFLIISEIIRYIVTMYITITYVTNCLRQHIYIHKQ